MADTDVLRRASAFRYDGTKIVTRNTADLDMEGKQILDSDINTSPIGGTTPAAGAFTTLKASTDPTDEHGVGDRGYNDLRYATKDLDATTSTDPAVNAAVSTAIIDAYGGVIITLTGAGNAQTLQDPTDTAAIKRFVVVTDDGNGAYTIEVNGITMSAGEAQKFIWDGSAWVAVTAVDADDIAFTPAGSIVATNVQAAIEEVDTEKLAKASNLSDVANAATAFGNIKQDATEGATGVIEKATTAEAVSGIDTDRAVTPAGLTARMEAPGEIGGTTPAAGNFTDVEISGEVQADVDMGGHHLLDCQTVQDLAAKGPGYWLPGVSSYIEIADNAEIDFGTEDFSLEFSIKPANVTDNTKRIISKTDGTTGIEIVINEDDLQVAILDNVNNVTLTNLATAIFTADKWSDILVSFDRDGDIQAYQNGKAVGTPVACTATATIDNASVCRIGTETGGTTHEITAEINKTRLYNQLVSSDEAIALTSGAPVPYEYLGASQDEMVTNGTFDADTDWTKKAGTTIGGGVATVTALGPIESSGNHWSLQQNITLGRGKQHKISFEARQTSGSGTFQMGLGYPVYFDQAITGSLVKYEFEFYYALSGSIALIFGGRTATDTFELDNIKICRAGCIAQYEQPGIGHNQWLDNSGNELHGVVSGAIPTNLPAGHVEQYPVTVTTDTLLTDVIPAKYILERVICEETAGSAAVICLGTTNGGSEVFLDETIAASDITVIEVNKMFSSTLAQTLDINDDSAGSDFNSATIDVTLMMRRVA